VNERRNELDNVLLQLSLRRQSGDEARRALADGTIFHRQRLADGGFVDGQLEK